MKNPYSNIYGGKNGVGHLKIKLLLTAVDIKHMEKKYVFLAHEKFARLSTKCVPAVVFLPQATQCNTSSTHVTPALNTSSCCACFFCRKSFFKYFFPKLPLSLLSGAPEKMGSQMGFHCTKENWNGARNVYNFCTKISKMTAKAL